jgi:Secretory lipase
LSRIPFGACIGISREHPDVDLLGALTPKGQAMVAPAAEMTVEQLLLSLPFLHWSAYLIVRSVYEIPGMRTAFEANRLGQATPTTTMFLYHAVHEQNLAVSDADKFVAKYRREGVDVTYRRFRFGEHIIVMLTGVPSSFRFLSERFGAA